LLAAVPYAPLPRLADHPAPAPAGSFLFDAFSPENALPEFS
jgi:hypothetical protein